MSTPVEQRRQRTPSSAERVACLWALVVVCVAVMAGVGSGQSCAGQDDLEGNATTLVCQYVVAVELGAGCWANITEGLLLPNSGGDGSEARSMQIGVLKDVQNLHVHDVSVNDGSALPDDDYAMNDVVDNRASVTVNDGVVDSVSSMLVRYSIDNFILVAEKVSGDRPVVPAKMNVARFRITDDRLIGNLTVVFTAAAGTNTSLIFRSPGTSDQDANQSQPMLTYNAKRVTNGHQVYVVVLGRNSTLCDRALRFFEESTPWWAVVAITLASVLVVVLFFVCVSGKCTSSDDETVAGAGGGTRQGGGRRPGDNTEHMPPFTDQTPLNSTRLPSSRLTGSSLPRPTTRSDVNVNATVDQPLIQV